MNLAQKIVFGLSVFLVIGLMYIAQFNVYQTDDFIFAYTSRDFGVVKSLITNYLEWGGRYIGYGLNQLNPLSSDSQHLFPKIYPIFLIAAIFILVAANFKEYFQYSWKKSWIKSFQFFFFYCVSLVALPEHFYWITGATVYTLGWIVLLLFIYALGRLKRSNNPTWKYIALFLLLPLMGFNEILSIFVLGHLFFQWKRKRDRTHFEFLLIGIIGFSVLFLAPGNYKRMGEETISIARLWFRRIGFFFMNELHIVLKTIIIAPLFCKIFEKELLFFIQRFGKKRVFYFWLLSLIPMVFTAYLQNSMGRQFELIIIYFLVTTSALIFYYFKRISKFWWLSLVVFMLPKINLIKAPYSTYNVNFNLFGLFSDISKGRPQKFENELLKRYQLIKDSRDKNIKLPPLKILPQTLYFDELSKEGEPKKYVNDQLEKYFDKDEIVIFAD